MDLRGGLMKALSASFTQTLTAASLARLCMASVNIRHAAAGIVCGAECQQHGLKLEGGNSSVQRLRILATPRRCALELRRHPMYRGSRQLVRERGGGWYLPCRIPYGAANWRCKLETTRWSHKAGVTRATPSRNPSSTVCGSRLLKVWIGAGLKHKKTNPQC